LTSKAKAALIEESLPTPQRFDLPFVSERLALHPGLDAPKNRDRTTQLCHLWKGLEGELQAARRRTFDYGTLQPDGKIEVHDLPALERELNEIDYLSERIVKVEGAVRKIIEAGGQYLSEIENDGYAYGNAENHIRRRLDVCYRNLTIQNKFMNPDQIIALPEYINLKKELDAEAASNVKILEQIKAKIAVYTAALESVEM